MNLTLRSYWRSSCSWRVRIALNLKNLQYDVVPVHLVADGGQQHAEEHRSLNPMRELPVLMVDGKPLAQSVAILEFLEDVAPEPKLLPTGAVDRALVRQMVEIINSGTQPVQNLRVMQKLGRDFELGKDSQLRWSKDWIEYGFVAFNKMVELHGGAYSFGDSLSLADLCLVPQLYNARRFGVDLTQFPRLVEIDESLASLPAFHAAHPDQQVDAP